MKFLEINGTDISHLIQDMSIELEPIWNTKAGRTLSGDYVGRITNHKWKIILETKPLTQSESSLIYKLLQAGSLLTVKFIPSDSDTETKKQAIMYVSPITSEIYSYNDRLIRYSSAAFNLIEK